MHVITEWNPESQALFAYNRYNSDFGNHAAFSCSTLPIHSYTGDRTEFLSRNSSTASPSALKRKTLSGHTGAALDPCAALICRGRVHVTLDGVLSASPEISLIDDRKRHKVDIVIEPLER
jgi:cellobiose phosphorylase